MNFDNPPSDPMPALRSWLDDARGTDLKNPTAMTLATVDPDGRPSARVVLLKELDGEGAVFFTNRESRKGRALAANRSREAAVRLHPGVLLMQEGIQRQMMSRPVEVVSLGMANHHRTAHLGTIGHPVEYPRAITVWLRETCRRVVQVVFQGRTLDLNGRPPQVLASVRI